MVRSWTAEFWRRSMLAKMEAETIDRAQQSVHAAARKNARAVFNERLSYRFDLGREIRGTVVRRGAARRLHPQTFAERRGQPLGHAVDGAPVGFVLLRFPTVVAKISEDFQCGRNGARCSR